MVDYIKSDQLVFAGLGGSPVVGFGCPEFYVKELDRNKANAIITKNHYSKKYYSASYIHLGVYIGGGLLGVLQFGYAMNPASMASVVAGTALDEYLELNRMWMDDRAERNSESRAISYAIKFIRRRYPKIKWIQSFADERCGRYGVVYQAANFEYYGEHTSVFWVYGDEIFHNSLMTRKTKRSAKERALQEAHKRGGVGSMTLRQFRYLYWLDRRCKAACALRQKPYPKHGTA